MSVMDTVGKINDIAREANKAFAGRNELIEAMRFCMASGSHMLIVGPPGTAKSALVSYFSSMAGLTYFRRVLNPDTLREDIVGPIDPMSLDKGEWDRKWSGLALCDVALLDEIGKASDQVLNMLLDAMEERRVTSGNTDMVIPMHLSIGATNELFQEVEAIWDRFTVRIWVRYLTDSSDFNNMLTSDVDAEHGKYHMTPGDLSALRAECKRMALSAPEKVTSKLGEMWREYPSLSDERISDRRWRRILTVAAGRALCMGRSEIDTPDLNVAKWMLWNLPEEHDSIQSWVNECTSPGTREFMDAKALVEELESSLEDAFKRNPVDLVATGQIYYKAQRLIKNISPKRGVNADWEDLFMRANDISEKSRG